MEGRGSAMGGWIDHDGVRMPSVLSPHTVVHLETEAGSGFGSFQAIDVQWNNAMRQNKLLAYRIAR